MLLALPILIPFATAIALKALPYRPVHLHWVSFGGALGLLASAVAILVRVQGEGIQVLQVAGWQAPFGITLVADPLSAILVTMVGIVAAAVTGNSFAGVDPRREALGYRPDAGFDGVVLAMLLVVAFAFGLSWLFTTVGLVMRSPSAKAVAAAASAAHQTLRVPQARSSASVPTAVTTARNRSTAVVNA